MYVENYISTPILHVSMYTPMRHDPHLCVRVSAYASPDHCAVEPMSQIVVPLNLRVITHDYRHQWTEYANYDTSRPRKSLYKFPRFPFGNDYPLWEIGHTGSGNNSLAYRGKPNSYDELALTNDVFKLAIIGNYIYLPFIIYYINCKVGCLQLMDWILNVLWW